MIDWSFTCPIPIQTAAPITTRNPITESPISDETSSGKSYEETCDQLMTKNEWQKTNINS